MHTYFIDKIIESNDSSKMERLKKLYVDTITYLKMTDYDKYREIECTLYEIVEGKKLTESKAKEWVESMRPKAKWSMEETTDVKNKYNVDIPAIDFYVLMNMMYSDFGKVIGEDLEKYVKLSEAWYHDEDINMDGSEKLYCYWKRYRA